MGPLAARRSTPRPLLLSERLASKGAAFSLADSALLARFSYQTDKTLADILTLEIVCD